MEDQREKDMYSISFALRNSKKYQLEIEVIYTAMKYLQNNTNASIEDAIYNGFEEWIK